MKNTKIILSSYPSGMPTENNFKTEQTDIPKLKDEEFLIIVKKFLLGSLD